MTGSIASKYTFAAHTYELLLLLLVTFLLVTAALLSGLALCQGFWDLLQVKRSLHSSVLVGFYCQQQNKQKMTEINLMPHASQKLLSLQGAKQPMLRACQLYPVQTQQARQKLITSLNTMLLASQKKQLDQARQE